MRQNSDKGKPDCSQNRDSAQYFVNIFFGLRTRTDSRDIRTGFSEVLCDFFRIHLQLRIEEGE